MAKARLVTSKRPPVLALTHFKSEIHRNRQNTCSVSSLLNTNSRGPAPYAGAPCISPKPTGLHRYIHAVGRPAFLTTTTTIIITIIINDDDNIAAECRVVAHACNPNCSGG
jgi:hypothetical protein